ncbi:hypothetical protein AMJ47_01680 [Parcubacteria bacterium DG_72]|nr:MAG: hypothetical protein AMJ47_01680 [Parcubacteria bacterium DG_72]
MENKFKKSKGFSLAELLIACFIIASGVTASYMIVQQIFAQTFEASNRLTAAYLAQEGAEIVRNIRDTGWIQGLDWTSNGLNVGCHEASYGDYSLTLCSGSGNYDDLSFYIYLNGNTSIFKRKITIERPTADSIKTTVDVLWKRKGQVHNVTIQSLLYDWK